MSSPPAPSCIVPLEPGTALPASASDALVKLPGSRDSLAASLRCSDGIASKRGMAFLRAVLAVLGLESLTFTYRMGRDCCLGAFRLSGKEEGPCTCLKCGRALDKSTSLSAVEKHVKEGAPTGKEIDYIVLEFQNGPSATLKDIQRSVVGGRRLPDEPLEKKQNNKKPKSDSDKKKKKTPDDSASGPPPSPAPSPARVLGVLSAFLQLGKASGFLSAASDAVHEFERAVAARPAVLDRFLPVLELLSSVSGSAGLSAPPPATPGSDGVSERRRDLWTAAAHLHELCASEQLLFGVAAACARALGSGPDRDAAASLASALAGAVSEGVQAREGYVLAFAQGEGFSDVVADADVRSRLKAGAAALVAAGGVAVKLLDCPGASGGVLVRSCSALEGVVGDAVALLKGDGDVKAVHASVKQRLTMVKEVIKAVSALDEM